MVKTGTRAKFKINTLKQQRENAELELIIREFALAMRNANRAYVTIPPACQHEGVRFTPAMDSAWYKYLEFCVNHR